MTNVYLEKIALTVEDVRDARQKGADAATRTQAKGMVPGLVVGAAAGAVLGRRTFSKMLSGLKGQGISENRLKGIKNKFTTEGSAFGGLVGTGVGGIAVNERARENHAKTYAKRINEGLSKSAAVTAEQVKNRSNASDAIVGTSAVLGSVTGTAAGVGSVVAHGAHKGMREHGGYGAIKDSLKNAYGRRKANKEIKVGKGAFLTRMEDLKPKRAVAKFVDRSGVARGVGNAVGSAVYKRGLVGAVAGSLIGGVGAGAIAQNMRDKADVNYYKKLHKASQNG